MKIALAQLDVKAGRPKLNVGRMLEMIEEAKDNGADLIAFPEMAVGGYLVGDKWTDDNYIRNLLQFNNMLAAAAEDIIVVYGNVYIPDITIRGYDGRQARYNSVYICYDRKVREVRHKTHLPTYRIFDDKRYFLSARDLTYTLNNSPVDVKGMKIGFQICEDMWWEDYNYNVTEAQVNNGAEFIINISCSPWTFGKDIARDNRISRMKEDLGNRFVPFYYVNACGVQNNGKNVVTFDGDSRAYNADGYKLRNHLNAYEEGILYFSKHTVTTSQRDLIPTDSKIAQKFNAILRAFKGLDEMMNWQPNYVYGLSGGVDSSLSCTLAVLALGKDRVKGFNLPSQYNSTKTKNAAEKLAINLDIDYQVLPIHEIVDSTKRTIAGFWQDDLISPLLDENIQAKTRGTAILSNLAAMHNGVMTNNGNKLEIALGYATLYGDVNGVFCPLGDLTKVEVWEMCRFINSKFEVEGGLIPEEMIPDENYVFDIDGIQPSAELKEAQIDPMIFGYHDRMLEMVMDYKKCSMDIFAAWYAKGPETLRLNMGLEDGLMPAAIKSPKWFFENLEWFFGAIQKNVFKRVQAPPIVMLSKTAYGYDYRESQFAFETSFEYDNIKKAIMKLNPTEHLGADGDWK